MFQGGCEEILFVRRCVTKLQICRFLAVLVYDICVWG